MAKERGGGPRDKTVAIHGAHPALAALTNPRRHIRAVYVTREAWSRLGSSLDDACTAAGIRPTPVQRETLHRHVPPHAAHQDIAVLADPLPAPGIDAILDRHDERAPLTLLALDQVTDPQNVGAALRAAAVFGAAAVITTKRNAPPESGALAKAASGGLDHVPWVRETNLARTLDTLREADIFTAGLAGDGETALPTVPGGRTAIVLGAEGAGLRRLTRERVDALARIPAPGPMPDLNVATAAAVALYEIGPRRAAWS